MIYFEANVTTTAPFHSMYPQHTQPNQPPHLDHQYSHDQYQPQPLAPQSQAQQPQPQPHTQPIDYDHNDATLVKFSDHDLQILKQLLVTGEKNKWKQITKDINIHALMRRNGVTNVQDLPPDSQVSSPTDDSFGGGSGGGNGNSKNVSPTFVMKQYQSLLGLPNNQLFFGSVGSSLPYLISERGWDDIQEE